LTPRHRRKRAGIDDPHEDLQGRKPVHLALHWNKKYARLRSLPMMWNR
jgi:hypothetical protein